MTNNTKRITWNNPTLLAIIKEYPVSDTRWEYFNLGDGVEFFIAYRYDFYIPSLSDGSMTDPWYRPFPKPVFTFIDKDTYDTTVEGHSITCVVYNQKPFKVYS
jgi:hypothetical protein